MESKQKPNDLTFEEAMALLEEIVDKLEKEDLPLEDSLKYFQEGIRLSRMCQDKLKEIEYKVEVIMKENEFEPPVLNEEES